MKSPLKDKPLRNPGQSLDCHIIDVVPDQQVKYLLIGLAFWIALISNWVYYLTENSLPPFWFTVIALVVFALCYYKITIAKKKIDPLAQGRDGERAVGQCLELLLEQGVKVSHDIPGDNFNLDHVLVAPSGVYVIETKTYSKPDTGQAKIVYTGDMLIHHNGFKDDKPLVQVKAAANWLKLNIKGRFIVLKIESGIKNSRCWSIS